MKNYNSQTEGIWIEKIQITLTEEEQALLTNTKEHEEKEELLSNIKLRSQISVDSPKLEVLTDFYTKIKSSLGLKETDLYQLISLDLTEKDSGKFIGILNCRVNNDHKQVRF